MIDVLFVYGGLFGAVLGLLSVICPLRRLGIRSRRRGAAVLAAGLATAVAGFSLPAPESRAETARTALDEFAPAWQFREAHSIDVGAPRETTYAAVQAVTPDEIRLFHTLTAMRRFGRPGPPNVLNAPERRPILETALRGGFLLLAEQPGHEIVLGTAMGRPPDGWPKGQWTPVTFQQLHAPRIAKIAMNFRLEDRAGGGSLLTTETRVYCTHAAGVRAFAIYWRLIYPGSSLIRRMWLRAIRARAEGAAAGR